MLDAPTAEAAALSRAQALAAAADLLQQTGSYATAEDYCRQALPIARAAEDNHLAGELLYLRAWILLRRTSAAFRTRRLYHRPDRAKQILGGLITKYRTAA